MSGFSRNKCLAFPGIPLLPEGNSVQSIGLRVIPYVIGSNSVRGSLNSLDLRNGGVALYLENFNRLELLGSVP